MSCVIVADVVCVADDDEEEIVVVEYVVRVCVHVVDVDVDVDVIVVVSGYVMIDVIDVVVMWVIA